MATAYVGVLTSVGKSIGLPTIGTTGVQYMQSPGSSNDSPIGIKQISENLRQFQNSVREVSRTVSNLVTREGPVDSNVLLTEAQKFLRLWSNQIQEVTDQVSRAFGGLEADVSTDSVFSRDVMSDLLKMFDQTINNIRDTVNRLMSGDRSSNGSKTTYPSEKPHKRQDQKPQNNDDMLREFMKFLENIRKRMRILSQQIDQMLAPPSDKLEAEHKELPNL